MKILILGGGGMLGHQLWRHFAACCDTAVTLRRSAAELRMSADWGPARVFSGIDVTDFALVAAVIRDVRPDAVINCIGIVKQLKEAKNPLPSIITNALLPHRLAEICGEIGARLVLFSTDCVFSGRQGDYRETDFADADDLYGRTKFLGEVGGCGHVITLRSSIVGRELGTSHSLLEWFLAQVGRQIKGYRRAIFSGFTTFEMARITERILTRHRELAGVWHVASQPISKYDLLCLFRAAFCVDVDIVPDDTFCCDRSLNTERFRQATGYKPPAWPAMIAELATGQP